MVYILSYKLNMYITNINTIQYSLLNLTLSYFNLYKSRSLARMMARGHRLCGRKPEYPEKTHVVEQVTT